MALRRAALILRVGGGGGGGGGKDRREAAASWGDVTRRRDDARRGGVERTLIRGTGDLRRRPTPPSPHGFGYGGARTASPGKPLHAASAATHPARIARSSSGSTKNTTSRPSPRTHTTYNEYSRDSIERSFGGGQRAGSDAPAWSPAAASSALAYRPHHRASRYRLGEGSMSSVDNIAPSPQIGDGAGAADAPLDASFSGGQQVGRAAGAAAVYAAMQAGGADAVRMHSWGEVPAGDARVDINGGADAATQADPGHDAWEVRQEAQWRERQQRQLQDTDDPATDDVALNDDPYADGTATAGHDDAGIMQALAKAGGGAAAVGSSEGGTVMSAATVSLGVDVLGAGAVEAPTAWQHYGAAGGADECDDDGDDEFDDEDADALERLRQPQPPSLQRRPGRSPDTTTGGGVDVAAAATAATGGSTSASSFRQRFLDGLRSSAGTPNPDPVAPADGAPPADLFVTGALRSGGAGGGEANAAPASATGADAKDGAPRDSDRDDLDAHGGYWGWDGAAQDVDDCADDAAWGVVPDAVPTTHSAAAAPNANPFAARGWGAGAASTASAPSARGRGNPFRVHDVRASSGAPALDGGGATRGEVDDDDAEFTSAISPALELEVHPSRRAVYQRNIDAGDATKNRGDDGERMEPPDDDLMAPADGKARQRDVIERGAVGDINRNPMLFRKSLKARFGEELRYELVVRTFKQLAQLGRAIESGPYEQSMYLLASVGRVECALRLLADVREGRVPDVAWAPIMYQATIEGCQFKSGQVARVLEQMAVDQAEFTPGILNAVVSVMYRNKARLDEVWAIYKTYVQFHKNKAAAAPASDARPDAAPSPPPAAAAGGGGLGGMSPATESAAGPGHAQFAAILSRVGAGYHASLSGGNQFLHRLDLTAKHENTAVVPPQRETYSMMMNLVETPQDVYRVATAMYAVIGEVPSDILDVGIPLGCETRRQALNLLRRLSGIIVHQHEYMPAVIRCAFKERSLGPAKDMFQRAVIRPPALYRAMIEGVAEMCEAPDDGFSQLVSDLLAQCEATNGPNDVLLRDTARRLLGRDDAKAADLMARYNAAMASKPAPEDAHKQMLRDACETALPGGESNPFLAEYTRDTAGDLYIDDEAGGEGWKNVQRD